MHWRAQIVVLSMSHREPVFKILNAVPCGMEHSPVATTLNAVPRVFCGACLTRATDETARGRARSSKEFGTSSVRMLVHANMKKLRSSASLPFDPSLRRAAEHAVGGEVSRSERALKWIFLSGQNLCLANLLVPIEHHHPECAVALQ